MTQGPGRRPTLKDVARAAGTSIKTVSRVVNREGTVSHELTVRVEEAIESLGYERDEWARRLRSGSGRTDAIGLIVYNLGDPFFASIAEGVESVASARGVLLITTSSHASSPRQDSIVKMLTSRRVDGLLIVPVGRDLTALEREAKHGTPLVFVDAMPEKLIGDAVLSDHKAAAVAAVNHLLAGGHRRIAFLGAVPTVHGMSERYRGYEEALAKAEVPLDPQMVRTGIIRVDDAANAVASLLDSPHPPTALFTAYIACTIGALRVLGDRDLQEDVAVVSSDDLLVGDLLSPGLTATPQDPYEIGRSAAGLLFRRLDGYDGPSETVKMRVDLIERGTGEIRPNLPSSAQP